MATIAEAIQQSSFKNEQLKANLNILYTANWLSNKISSQLKPFKLTHEQFNVLRILRGKHPQALCQKDILSRMIAPNSNLTLLVKKLLDKDLIALSQSQIDKRQYQIKISKAGLKLLERIDKNVDFQNNTFNALNTSEAFHLNALLDKLREE